MLAATFALKASMTSILRAQPAAAAVMIFWKKSSVKPAKREAVTSMPLRLMPGTLSTWVSSDMRSS